MRNLTCLLVFACGYLVPAAVAVAQVPPPPGPQTQKVTINFTPGSARLSNIAKAKLDEIALRMKQEPDSRAQVIGYGPNDGSPSAQRLGDQRASAVKNYLVTRHGIDPARITTSGQVDSGNVCPEQGRCAVLTLVLPQ
jgi:outer membrane protein OmpA-like peptidoglycan-associated protein